MRYETARELVETIIDTLDLIEKRESPEEREERRDELTEGAVKGLLNDMGYFFTDEGKHAGKWVHEKTREVLSDEDAMKKAAKRHARKVKIPKGMSRAERVRRH